MACVGPRSARRVSGVVGIWQVGDEQASRRGAVVTASLCRRRPDSAGRAGERSGRRLL